MWGLVIFILNYYERKMNLSLEMINSFEKSPALAISNVARAAGIKQALRSQEVKPPPRLYTHTLEDVPVEDQGKSGRCWMYAFSNLIRRNILTTYKIKEFEISHTYLQFFDKLERANTFLNFIRSTRDSHIDDRLLNYMFVNLLSDGGQWHMAVCLTEKYGIVPLSAMPEVYDTQQSGFMNNTLRQMLFSFAYDIRNNLTTHTDNLYFMQQIYNVLVVCMGRPPTEFEWVYQTEDLDIISETLTPLQLLKKYIGPPLESFVTLIHCPCSTKELSKVYTVENNINIEGSTPSRYLTVSEKELEDMTKASIKADTPVWFGCEYHAMNDSKHGILHSKLYNYSLLGDTVDVSDKARAIDIHYAEVNHAMLITGVCDLRGQTSHWKVQNSHGKKSNTKDGYIDMSNCWFRRHVYQIAVPKSILSEKLRDLIEHEVEIPLAPWDIMGNLATVRTLSEAGLESAQFVNCLYRREIL